MNRAIERTMKETVNLSGVARREYPRALDAERFAGYGIRTVPGDLAMSEKSMRLRYWNCQAAGAFWTGSPLLRKRRFSATSCSRHRYTSPSTVPADLRHVMFLAKLTAEWASGSGGP
jgi:hypothetical protein